MPSPSTRSIRRALLGALLTAVALFVPASAQAVVPYKDITSSGPLTHVYLGNELSCQIAYAGDRSLELYPPRTIPGDCGTFVAVDGVLFAPNFREHGGTATGSIGTYTAFTPVSQTDVTGTGTASDPYRVTTVARLGDTGLQISQIDSYVTGQEVYRTDTTVQNTGGAAKSLVLYRAGDCYLQESDTGFGFTESPNAVGCSKNANNQPAGRIEEWYPVTANNTYLQGRYSSDVWTAISTKNPFANTCKCTEQIDQGAGIAWSSSVGAGGQQTFAHYTRFSPTGVIGAPPGVAAPPSQTDRNDTVRPGEVIQLPPSRRCVSRRNFRIRLRRPAGVTLLYAKVFVNGRSVRVTILKERYRTIRGRVLLRKRITARVDLRGLPAGRFKVEIRAVTTSLRVLRGTRRYRTCARKVRSPAPPRV